MPYSPIAHPSHSGLIPDAANAMAGQDEAWAGGIAKNAGQSSPFSALARYLTDMQKLDAAAVAKLLIEFGRRTELGGGNPYRARAYYKAAENLLALTVPLDEVIAQGRLREIPGVGDVIADIIAKLHKAARIPSSNRCAAKRLSACSICLVFPACAPTKH
jgi:Helix-hairpin-helix domain